MIGETAGGVAIGYDDLGMQDASAVILIGGLATQRTVWPDILCDRLVAAGYRVIRFDNRDAGQSTSWPSPSGDALARLVREPSGAPLPYTLDDMAGDVIGLMDLIGVERAHVAGMSMGGRIAQCLAAAWPNRVISLVSMMSTTGNPTLPQATPEAMQALMTPPRDPFDEAAVADLAIMQQGVIGSPAYPMPDDYVREVVALNFQRGNNPDGVMRQWLASAGAGDRRVQLKEIEAPTLVLHGRDDPLIPWQAGQDTAETIRGARLTVIDGWGHNIAPTISKLLADEMTSFWSSVENR